MKFCVYQDAGVASQQVVSGVWTKVRWDLKEWDTSRNFDFGNYRWTAYKPGFYHVDANIEFADIPDGGVCDIAIYINGAQKVHTQYMCASAGQFVTAHISRDIFLKPGDYVEIYCKHNAGSNKVISTSSEETWWTLHNVKY